MNLQTYSESTKLQQSTISQLKCIVERLNGKQTVSIYRIRKGHVALGIFNRRDSGDAIITQEFVKVDINTKGNIVNGFVKEYSPKETVVYPYIN